MHKDVDRDNGGRLYFPVHGVLESGMSYSRVSYVTGGKMKGRKEVRVDVSKGKSITGMMTGRKEAGVNGTTEKGAGRKVKGSESRCVEQGSQ